MAEREGFEPSIRFCRILTFQASAFDHSATAPHSLEGGHLRGRAELGKVAGSLARPYLPSRMTPAERLSGRMPTPEGIEAIARRTLDRLPAPFSDSLGDIVLLIEEVADAETARSVGLEHPMQLSGLYSGVPLNHQSVQHSGMLPERITLYRRPIIAEWRSTRVSLDRLVSHILIHEVGHHFGFSDDDMHALEDSAE